MEGRKKVKVVVAFIAMHRSSLRNVAYVLK
jgi:hypothetical protein